MGKSNVHGSDAAEVEVLREAGVMELSRHSEGADLEFDILADAGRE
jgi:hypothetical protein